jgi:DNA helicase-2/ATP-dependent DNA helicase PcrA
MLEERAFPARAEAALSGFQRMMETIAQGIESRPVAETLGAVLRDTGYREMLEQEGTQEALGRLGNLEELLNAAADADQRGETLRGFLDHAALVSDADAMDERAPVALLTMHNAKGLEFPVVFIAGLEEGLFPHSRSISDSESAMEEERRLCYVGMTRARKRLYLSWAKTRRRFGGGTPEATIRSRFLMEIPPGLIQQVGSAGAYSTGQVDLTAEQSSVRETAKRNLYTGKTHNSVESIQQYFANRAKAAAAPAPPAAAKMAPRPEAPARRKVGPGSVIQHERFGRGSIVKVEGSGEDAKVTVNFDRIGLKKMVAKYAGIKIE